MSVCVHARVFVCVSMRACVVVGARARACACARVALLINHKEAAVFLSASSLALPYFSTLSHKRYNFRKKKFWNKKCVF